MLQPRPCCKTRLGCANALHTEEGLVADNNKKGSGNDVGIHTTPELDGSCVAQRDGRYEEPETRFTQPDLLIDRVVLAFT